MKAMKTSSELINKYEEISSICKETQEPILITVDGNVDTVILSIERFNQMQSELELFNLLSESVVDERNHRLKPIDNDFNNIRKKVNL